MATELVVSDVNAATTFAARGRAAVVRLRPQIDAIDAKTVIAPNADVTLAVSRALGLVPAVMAMRERIRRDCAVCDQAAIDELEERAYAAATASAAYDTAMAPPDGFQPMVQEAFDARAVLVLLVRGLIAVNLFKQDQLASQRGGHGYADVAHDLLDVTGLLLDNWTRIEGKIAVTQANLDRLHGLAEAILAMLGKRELNPERVADAADLRNRTFMLLDAAYSEARRAITFLRWNEGDADAIAPPLRSRPVVRKNDKDEEPAKTEPATTTSSTEPARKEDVAAPLMAKTPDVHDVAAPVPGLPHSDPYGRE